MYSKNFGQGPKWIPGEIVESTGPVSFLVKLVSGQIIRRHQDHLRFRHHNLSEEASSDQRERVEVEIDTSCEVAATTGIMLAIAICREVH